MTLLKFLLSIDFLHFFYGLVFFLIALRVRKGYLKGGKTDILLKSFMMMFFFWGVFEWLRAAPHIYIILGREDLFPQAMRWGYIISHFFLVLAAAYAFVIPASLYWPKWQKLGIGLIIFFGIINAIILIATPFIPEYHMEEGFTLMNGPLIALPPLGLALAMGLGTTAVVFLGKALKGEVKGILRIRSWLIGIGILLIIISGPSHNFVKTAGGTFFLDMISLTGKIVTAVGVLVFKPREEPKQFYRKVSRETQEKS